MMQGSTRKYLLSTIAWALGALSAVLLVLRAKADSLGIFTLIFYLPVCSAVVMCLLGLFDQRIRCVVRYAAFSSIGCLTPVFFALRCWEAFDAGTLILAVGLPVLWLTGIVGGLCSSLISRRFYRIDIAEPRPSGTCPKCDYSLTGLPANVCPECGYKFSYEEIGMSKKELHARAHADDTSATGAAR